MENFIFCAMNVIEFKTKNRQKAQKSQKEENLIFLKNR